MVLYVLLVAKLVLTPEKVVDLALRRNLAVKRAVHQLRASEAKVEQAKALTLPRLSFSHAQVRLEPIVTFAIPVFDPITGRPVGMQEIEITKRHTYQSQLSLSYPLYTWGRLRANVRREEKAKEATYHSYQLSRLQAAHRARQAFFNLLRALRFKEVAEKSVEQVRAHLDVARKLFREGLVAKYDVLRAEAALSQAEEGLTRAENAVEMARSALLSLLDLPQDTEVEVSYGDRQVLEIARSLPPLEECIRRAKRERPEAKQLRATLESLRYALKAAKAGNKPMLSLATTYTRKTATGFAKNWDWSVVLAVSWPLFDGGLTKAQVKEASEGIKQLETTLRELENGIELDVRQAYLGVKEALKRLESAEKALKSAEESFRLAKLRFREGLGTTVEVLDAEAALTRARATKAQALYDLEISLSNLARAMGSIELPRIRGGERG